MRKSKAETTETIRKIIHIARTHFTEHGYAGTSLEAVVQDAQLTRGAVYHHFRNKKELFRAVLSDVQQEVAARVEADASVSEDVWQQLQGGCRGFILAAVEHRNKRIMLIDGPAIMGWDAWRELDHHHSMRLLREQLTLMQRQGYFPELSIEALTHFISGGLNELALWLAERPEAIEDAMKLLEVMLEGIQRK